MILFPFLLSNAGKNFTVGDTTERYRPLERRAGDGRWMMVSPSLTYTPLVRSMAAYDFNFHASSSSYSRGRLLLSYVHTLSIYACQGSTWHEKSGAAYIHTICTNDGMTLSSPPTVCTIPDSKKSKIVDTEVGNATGPPNLTEFEVIIPASPFPFVLESYYTRESPPPRARET